MHYPIRLLLLICALLPALPATAAESAAMPEWKLAKNDSSRDIRVYLRQEPGKRLLSFRLETRLEARPEAIAGVLLDFEHYCEWVYRCAEVRVLKKHSEFDYTLYLRHKGVPPLVKDRDSVLYAYARRDVASKAVIVRTKALPDYLQPNRRYVRVPHEDMIWVLRPTKDGNHIQLELTGNIDTAGKVPVGMVNPVLTRVPYYTVRGLRDMLQKDRYRNPALAPNIDALLDWVDGEIEKRRSGSE